MIVVRNNGCALFADRHLAGVTKILERHFVESHRLVFADQGAARENGDISQGCFSTVSEGRSTHRCHLEDTAALVHHQGGQCFPLDFFRED